MMKSIKLLVIAVAGSAFLTVTGHAQGVIGLNFSSSPGATIQFNGASSSFQFNASTYTGFGGVFNGTQWFIGNENGGTGSAAGLFGSVLNGPFSYGAITTSGSVQSANVLGPLGQLVINDGSGYNLTGNVDWVQVSTHDYGGSIGINAALTINVTGLSYLGSNPDLLTLAANSLAGMGLTFQFSPGETLSDLTLGSNPFTTSFSGSIAPAPEPASAGLVLLGLGTLVLTRRFKQNEHA